MITSPNYIFENKLYIPEKLLKYTHSQLKLKLSENSKKCSWDVISNYLTKYFKDDLRHSNPEIYNLFNSLSIGLSAANIERALKGKKGNNKVHIKYELLDFICYAVWGKSLALTIFDTDQKWGDKIVYDIVINDYATEDILNNYHRLIEYNQKKSEHTVKHAIMHNSYAKLLIDKFNDLKGAEENYKKAVEINPDNVNAHKNYAFFLKKELHDFNAAKHHYEIALELKPEDIAILNNLAVLLVSKFKEYETAKSYYEKAIQIKPDYILAIINYADLLYTKYKDFNKAGELFLQALSYNPQNEKTLNDYGLFLEKKQDYIGAKTQFEKALSINNDLYEIHYNYARLLNKRFNNPERAKFHFQEAIKLKRK